MRKCRHGYLYGGCPECERVRLNPPLVYYRVEALLEGGVLKVVREYPRYRVVSFVPLRVPDWRQVMFRIDGRLIEEQRRTRGW